MGLILVSEFSWPPACALGSPALAHMWFRRAGRQRDWRLPSEDVGKGLAGRTKLESEPGFCFTIYSCSR